MQYNNYNPIMAHELNMSVTGYLHIKDLLVPKHLAVSQHTRKKQAMRKDFLQESPADIASQHKDKRLKPIGEIEAIMRHFNAKFTNQKPRKVFFEKERKRERKISQEGEEGYERELEQKMSYLLQLPVIGTIRKEAQRYRNMINAEEIKEREEKKAKIMENFKQYMKAELKSTQVGRKRLNTIN